ncbi:hypothetical protein ACFRCX_30755 [Streptomyces sp. NPDC056652]|uniref:hypothetical protein n=1 Tax=Streptomyces sp. NPDC056652 TaxID=3345893 RepID=UPI00368E8E82
MTHPDPLTTAENELARLRQLIARVATWINNPNHDPTARHHLAQHIGLPTPRTTKENPQP